MSNNQGAFGLRPVMHKNGAPWNGQTQPCYISAAYATALYIGTPVLLSPTLGEKDTTGRYQTINASSGADGTIIWGVIVSFEPLLTDLTKLYNPASTERIAHVCTDRDVLYAIRGSGGGSVSKVLIGQNAVIYNSGGSTVTGLSSCTLDEGISDAPAADQSNPLLIEGIVNVEDNTLADYAMYLVSLNTRNATGDVLGVTAT